MDTMTKFLISLYFIILVIKLTESDGQLSLKFIDFENPGHRLESGDCCEASCRRDCNVFFRICLSLKSQALCSLMFIVTPVLGDDSFTFGTSLGNGQSNPLLYSFDQWTEHFSILIMISALNGGRADLINMNSTSTSRQPDKDSSSAVAQAATLRGSRSVLKLSYKIYCGVGYFKPWCNESCRATNDSSGHYTCDFDKAERVCMKNWYGPRCTTYCQARNDNTRGHYRCDSGSGAKICLPDWYGEDCKRYCRGRNDSQGHYTCDTRGNRVCLVNWGGVDCMNGCSAGERFYCTKNRTIVCQFGWFGTNCSQYCVPSSGPDASYNCSENGTKICSENWYNENCDKYCKNESEYFCDANGRKIQRSDLMSNKIKLIRSSSVSLEKKNFVFTTSRLSSNDIQLSTDLKQSSGQAILLTTTFLQNKTSVGKKTSRVDMLSEPKNKNFASSKIQLIRSSFVSLEKKNFVFTTLGSSSNDITTSVGKKTSCISELKSNIFVSKTDKQASKTHYSVYATSSQIVLPSKVLHSKVMSQTTSSNASNSNSNIQKPNLRTLIYIGVPILFVIVALLLILAGREIYRNHV
eukprot:gene18737-20626_t